MDNTILLIDGSSFIFRAFYAVRNLTSPTGMPTNAIYGVINMLKQMQKKYTTPYWVCVFDAKGKTFRDDIYPEYKSNRKATPDELVQQIPYILELVTDLGIPVIVQEGVEADDVIATIAQYYARQNYQIHIATGDKDFAQIVNDNITLINTMTDEKLDRTGVIDKFGVTPEQIIDYLSLIGDTADGVPGVHKCGPKTAQKWLNEYGCLNNITHNQDQLSGTVGENFRAAKDWLPIAKKLITIDCNVDIQQTDITILGNLMVKPENLTKLINVYSELNFRTWLKEANLKATIQNLIIANEIIPAIENNSGLDLFSIPHTDTPIELNHEFIIIDSLDKCSKIIDEIVAQNQLSAANIINDVHGEINSPLVGILIETATKNYLIKFMVSTTSDELFLSEENSFHDYYAMLRKYWTSTAPKIVAGAKECYYQLNRLNIQANNIVGDLSLASYIHYSSAKHTIIDIIERTTNVQIPSLEQIFGKGVKRCSLSQLPQPQQIEYLQSICRILPTHEKILAQLSADEYTLYNKTELPLANLLYRLECVGIKIDVAKLKELSVIMHSQLKILEDKVRQKSGCVFNLNSPAQMQNVLFNELKLPVTGIKKIASGYSTNEESLSLLSEQGFEIADLLLEYRYLNKLLNTYIDTLPKYADNKSLIHTSLEQTVVTSGRLSSKDPNLQNIPVRSEYGQYIRECFVATDNHQLICADYSQIELRILAHISQDENLTSAFNSGLDIHLATASQIFGKPIELISKDERRYAKSINFGLIYGKSVFGLAKELKIDRAAAKLYIDNYFAQYPKVKLYMDNIKQQAHLDGYVSTIYGRKIYLPNINSSNAILRQAEERLALNAPMQGTASDIIKIAMLNIDNWLAEQKLATKMILQVHDELIFNAPIDEVDLVLENLPRLMSEKTILAVQLEIEAKSANNWGLAH